MDKYFYSESWAAMKKNPEACNEWLIHIGFRLLAGKFNPYISLRIDKATLR